MATAEISSDTDLAIHELASLFPPMSDEELSALAEDIREYGLRDRIVLFEQQILDGRHRFSACKIAGVEPEFMDFSGDDPLAYVLSRNLRRRHLSESQRALVAARISNMRSGRPVKDAENAGENAASSESGSGEPLSIINYLTNC